MLTGTAGPASQGQGAAGRGCCQRAGRCSPGGLHPAASSTRTKLKEAFPDETESFPAGSLC